tara:strand:+ start:215 stop:382 length:168 start_codon:yes stop_codon:yes gene_type:complete
MKTKTEDYLRAYQQTINRIDDFFEYSNESAADKMFIRGQLEALNQELIRITNEEL